MLSSGPFLYCFVMLLSNAVFLSLVHGDPQPAHVFAHSHLPARQFTFLLPARGWEEAKTLSVCEYARTGLGNTVLMFSPKFSVPLFSMWLIQSLALAL